MGLFGTKASEVKKSKAAELRDNCQQYLEAFFQDLANCGDDLTTISEQGLPPALGCGRAKILEEVARRKNLNEQSKQTPVRFDARAGVETR
jgi:hypothetical protein